MKGLRTFSKEEIEVEKYVEEVIDEYIEWSGQRPLDNSEVRTLIWDMNDKTAVILNTRGKVEKKIENVSSVDELIGKIEAEGLTPIAQVEQAPRVVVPVAPGRRIITPGPRPVVPEAPVVGSPESQIEYLRRRIEATLAARDTTFTFEVLYHIKPLTMLDGLKGDFFSGTLKEGEATNIRSSFYGIPLWFFATIKIATNTDYMYEKFTVDTGTSTITKDSETLSTYGNGSVSLDQAVELLMASLSAGYFDFVDNTNQSILRIPTVNWKNNFHMIDVERSFTNTVVSGATMTNFVAKTLHFSNEANTLSFDLLGYARKVGLKYHITYVPGNHYVIKFEGNFQPPTAVFQPSAISTENILSEYFFNENGKPVPGYIQVSLPTVVFGVSRA